MVHLKRADVLLLDRKNALKNTLKMFKKYFDIETTCWESLAQRSPNLLLLH
uniref:Uncharacterized protein n=1 Tax=Arion vulgaris TaxID=1028688 RepID=A0A0B7B6V7_9EUPU